MKTLREYIDILYEIEKADSSEYDVASSDSFAHRAPLYSQLTQMSNQLVLDQFPNAVKHTEKSDSGNFIAQWFDTDQYVFIVGIVTKQGRLIKDDLPDIKKFIDKLIDALSNGKTIISSPNKKSQRLINKIEKIANKRNIRLKIEKIDLGNAIGGDPNDPELQFQQITIRAV